MDSRMRKTHLLIGLIGRGRKNRAALGRGRMAIRLTGPERMFGENVSSCRMRRTFSGRTMPNRRSLTAVAAMAEAGGVPDVRRPAESTGQLGPLMLELRITRRAG